MRKSSRKMVSLMVAASMTLTTVMANSSMVMAAYDFSNFPVEVTGSSNAQMPLVKTFAENEDVDITFQFKFTTERTGGGGLFVLQTPKVGGGNTDSNLKVKANGACTALSWDFDGEGKTVAVSATDYNTINIKVERATGNATITNVATGESVSAVPANGIKKDANCESEVISGFKVDRSKGSSLISYIKCGTGADAVTSGTAVEVTPGGSEGGSESGSENSSENSSENATEGATEESTEATTEGVKVDLGAYDKSSSAPQIRVDIDGVNGLANVKAGDTITAQVYLTGNPGIADGDFFVHYDSSKLKFVSIVEPDDNSDYIFLKKTAFCDVVEVNTEKAEGLIHVAFVSTTSAVATGDGKLMEFTFTVTGTEGESFIRAVIGEVNGETSFGFGTKESHFETSWSGTKLVIGSDEETTETTTEEVTETTTVTTTEEEVETTTKKKTSGGGGGSSSNAAKENNSKDNTIGSVTAKPSDSNDDSTQKPSSNTTSTNKPVQATVGAYETPAGITINPPALMNADGEVVAGSKLNNSSLVPTNNFNDMSSRAWAQNAVNKLASIGVINGVGEGKFAPDATSKRGDFMVMLTKVLGVTGTAQSSFSDVPADKYYANAVNLAKDLGLANGVGDNKFNPEAPITRQDMMVLTAKALEVVGYDVASTDVSVLDKYADADKIADYAKPYVAFLIENGLVNGTSDSTVDPTANMTRAQMAVLMSNLYDLITDAVVEAQEAEAEAEAEAAEATEEEATEATEATEEVAEEAEATEATEDAAEDAEKTEEEATEDAENADEEATEKTEDAE